jgi:hypothetical protein
MRNEVGSRGGILGAVIGLVALLTSAAGFTGQDEMVVAADRQVPLLLKILTYDRRLEARAGEQLVIGIVCSPTSAASVKAREEVSAILQGYLGKTVKKIPIEFYWHDYVNPDRLLAWVKARKVDVFYLSPGNEKNLAAILKVGQENGITSMTGVPEYVERGVAVGIGERQAKPPLLLTLEASRRDGSEFDASLLRVATIVK